MIYYLLAGNYVIQVLNVCILQAKYYICIQKLMNSNDINLLSYMGIFKTQTSDREICKNQNTPNRFLKNKIENIY